MSRPVLFTVFVALVACGPSDRRLPAETCEGETCNEGEGPNEPDGHDEIACDGKSGRLPFGCACAGPSECVSDRCEAGVCDALVVSGKDFGVPSSMLGRVGERFAFDCEPDFRVVDIWGTGIYTSQSGACTAAVHSGLFRLEDGGRVVIETRPGLSEYSGSDQNGIKSLPYGRWSTAFAVLPLRQCFDGIKNGNETDVDCGGECKSCRVEPDNSCAANEECPSGQCVAGECAPETCANGRKDANEDDVDCGGPCAACQPPQACVDADDCFEGTCVDGFCKVVYECDERSIDRAYLCACENTQRCMSNKCEDGVCAPQPVAVSDHLIGSRYRDRIGDRFAYDCAPNLSKRSTWGTDIYTFDSGVCTAAVHSGKLTFEDGGRVVIEIWPGQDSYPGSSRNGVTSSAWSSPWPNAFVVLPFGQCFDGVRNGNETGIDCGGDCRSCDAEPDNSCAANEQCPSGQCVAGECAPESCANGLQDGDEEGVDCGGSCATCACATDADCSVGTCVAQSCVVPPACDSRTDERAYGCACEEADQCASTNCIDGVCDAFSANRGGLALPLSLRSRVGERFAFECAPDHEYGTVWGTDIYTSDSPVCRAAIHAGVFAMSTGGRAVVQVWPGLSSYEGTDRNGVESRSWSRYSSSIVLMNACADGVRNSDETDVDCGGSVCGPCAVGASCKANEDCDQSECVEGRCANEP